jgi:GDP-mannose 6-dehydrogenase
LVADLAVNVRRVRISVFGLGYVGAVSSACLADLGHEVVGVDVSAAKVATITSGRSPIVEPHLAERLTAHVASGRLRATTDAAEAVRTTDVALVCVGTPSTASGGIDTTHLDRVCEQIGAAIADQQPEAFHVIVRSTCMPPVHQQLQQILEDATGRRLGEGLGYVCHPEFLREGAAVADFFDPPKIVFGASDPAAAAMCDQLYPGIDEAPVFHVTPEVAALVKYADNCFHAVKVTFGNEIGLMCRHLGVDAHEVMDIFVSDTKLNISPKYLRPGSAFGGSCLPKDLRGLLDQSRLAAQALPMLAGTLESNRIQIEALLHRIVGPDRPSVGIVGLAFKELTDDVRESPMVTLVEGVSGKGHQVRVYDEHLSVNELVGSNLSFAVASIPHLAELLTNDLAAVVAASDVVVVSHRLTPAMWRDLPWRPGVRVIDLANVAELHELPGYEGLYW